MDKRMMIAGAIVFALGVVVWILNIQMGIGWHYGGETFYMVDAVLTVALPFFGLLFVYLGILPNQSASVEKH